MVRQPDGTYLFRPWPDTGPGGGGFVGLSNPNVDTPTGTQQMRGEFVRRAPDGGELPWVQGPGYTLTPEDQFVWVPEPAEPPPASPPEPPTGPTTQPPAPPLPPPAEVNVPAGGTAVRQPDGSYSLGPSSTTPGWDEPVIEITSGPNPGTLLASGNDDGQYTWVPEPRPPVEAAPPPAAPPPAAITTSTVARGLVITLGTLATVAIGGYILVSQDGDTNTPTQVTQAQPSPADSAPTDTTSPPEPAPTTEATPTTGPTATTTGQDLNADEQEARTIFRGYFDACTEAANGQGGSADWDVAPGASSGLFTVTVTANGTATWTVNIGTGAITPAGGFSAAAARDCAQYYGVPLPSGD